MAEGSPLSDDEQRRRSAAALFLKVHDLDDAVAAGSAQGPVARLCNLMISEGLYANGDELRVCAPTTESAQVQLHREGTWVDIMRVPAQAQSPVVNRLKVMANLDIAKRPLQEGTLKVRLQGQVLSLAITVRLRGTAEEASLHLPPRASVTTPPEPEAAT
jgi:type II secretory ATPase GspE/PulE/Tfp pilus assembly ATPase PilB-like protein